MLYVRRPMLRGDDVVELQRRLNTLGFDAGKEDGIFGPDTAGALTEFQRNAGLGCDGIFGPDTADSLARIGALHVGTLAVGSVASVREREVLRRGPHRIEGRRVFLAVAPGFVALADLLVHGLLEAGATVVLDSSGSDDSALAAAANRYEADLFFGVRPGEEPGCRCSYYASGQFRSEAGYKVATAVSGALSEVLEVEVPTCGRRHTALRETSMAAVLCEPTAHDDVAGTRRLVTARSRRCSRDRGGNPPRRGGSLRARRLGRISRPARPRPRRQRPASSPGRSVRGPRGWRTPRRPCPVRCPC